MVSLYPAPGTGAGYRPRVPDIGMVVPDEFALFHPYFDFLCRNMRKRNESTEVTRPEWRGEWRGVGSSISQNVTFCDMGGGGMAQILPGNDIFRSLFLVVF